MEEYSGDFCKCDVVDLNIPNFGFKEHDCLGNAYLVASNTGAMMVEGLLRVSGSAFNEHVWNKIGDWYFDPTKKYIFETDGFMNQLRALNIGELNCEYVKCCEYPITECNIDSVGNLSFKYSYKTMKDIANKK